jgi:hypothetical protein
LLAELLKHIPRDMRHYPTAADTSDGRHNIDTRSEYDIVHDALQAVSTVAMDINLAIHGTNLAMIPHVVTSFKQLPLYT